MATSSSVSMVQKGNGWELMIIMFQVTFPLFYSLIISPSPLDPSHWHLNTVKFLFIKNKDENIKTLPCSPNGLSVFSPYYQTSQENCLYHFLHFLTSLLLNRCGLASSPISLSTQFWPCLQKISLCICATDTLSPHHI